MIETKETTVIYSGLLKNYELLDNSDELACIILTAAFRRDLRKSQLSNKDIAASKETIASSFHSEYGDIIPIPGHVFTIPGKSIINLNVTYMKQIIDPATQKQVLTPISFS